MSRRYLLAALTLMFMVVGVGDLASESVTLTTYYPAPSGVYTQMITTGQTWLARDGGGVSVGTTNTPSSGTGMAVMGGSLAVGTITQKNELDVAGGAALGAYGGSSVAPGNGLIVSGSVGIGTAGPGYKLEVNGSGGANIDTYVHGRIMTGDGSNSGGVWLDSAQNMFIGQNGATAAGIYVSGAAGGWALNVQESNGYVGILNNGVYTPAAPLDVNGGIVSRQTACSAVHFTDGAVVCGGSYATLISGFYSEWVAMGTPDHATGTAEGGFPTGSGGFTGSEMTALCCPFPGGAAVF